METSAGNRIVIIQGHPDPARKHQAWLDKLRAPGGPAR
jgi:hypothetical protein